MDRVAVSRRPIFVSSSTSAHPARIVWKGDGQMRVAWGSIEQTTLVVECSDVVKVR